MARARLRLLQFVPLHHEALHSFYDPAAIYSFALQPSATALFRSRNLRGVVSTEVGGLERLQVFRWVLQPIVLCPACLPARGFPPPG